MKYFYRRMDKWVKDLPRTGYALVIGASASIGVLVIGLLVLREILVFQAVTSGITLFCLEYVFGLWRKSS